MSLLFLFFNFLTVGWTDVIDVLLVAFLLFQLYQLVKGSVASRIMVGIVAVFFVWLLVSALEMELLSTILGQFMEVGVIAALILFQQEIRKFLLVIGKVNYFNNALLQGMFGGAKTNVKVDVFVEAAQEMAVTQTGALIVFAKSSELKFHAESGDRLDAVASKRLIISVFNKHSPLHDGAMIIGQSGRINAVRCILPVSENSELPAMLGLRHRAAIGLTEVTDAIVLVVSEERGAISVVKNGRIFSNLNPQELKRKLLLYLTEDRHLVQAEDEKLELNKDSHLPVEDDGIEFAK
jgi:uncharacterized protein (TIGR00159 family)